MMSWNSCLGLGITLHKNMTIFGVFRKRLWSRARVRASVVHIFSYVDSYLLGTYGLTAICGCYFPHWLCLFSSEVQFYIICGILFLTYFCLVWCQRGYIIVIIVIHQPSIVRYKRRKVDTWFMCNSTPLATPVPGGSSEITSKNKRALSVQNWNLLTATSSNRGKITCHNCWRGGMLSSSRKIENSQISIWFRVPSTAFWFPLLCDGHRAGSTNCTWSHAGSSAGPFRR